MTAAKHDTTYSAVIIGAGITGLTCAYKISHEQEHIAIVEPGQIGGLISTSLSEGFTLEHGPNVLIEKDSLAEIIDDLALRDSVIYPKTKCYRQYVWHNAQLQQIPRALKLLISSKLLPLRHKLNIPIALFKSHKCNLEDESVGDFFSRLFGISVAKNIIDPALKGLFGGDIFKLSARSIFPLFWEHVCAGHTVLSYMFKKKSARIFVLKGGTVTLVKALMQKLSPRIFIQDRISKISYDGAFQLLTEAGQSMRATRVYICTSGPASAKLLESITPDLSRQLSELTYAALVVVHLATTQTASIPDNSFGVLFPSQSKSPILGIMFNSVLFPHVAPQGKHLLTVMLGGADNLQVLEKTDQEIVDIAADQVKKVLGLTKIQFLALKRWQRAIPQYLIGHHRLESAFCEAEKKYPGLRLVGADRRGIGVADRIKAVYDLC